MVNVRVFLLATYVLFTTNLNAFPHFLTEEDFLNRARQLAATNGSRVISSEDNSGCNPITVIMNDDSTPFAVLKGNRLIENFIYKYAEGTGLSDIVAPSYSINSLEIKGQNPYSGAIEEFIPVISYRISENDLPQDMVTFIDKYNDSQGTLNLARFSIKCSEEDRQFLYKKVSKENLDKLFVFFVLTHLHDMTKRNALLTVNANQQFEFMIMDTHECFANSPPRNLTFILGFPQAEEPLLESVRSLIPSIIAKRPSFKEAIKSSVRTRLNATKDCGGYGQQSKRIQSLDEFLNQYPKASLRALMVFAFWNTFYTNHEGTKVNLAEKILESISCGSYGSFTLENQRVAFDKAVWSLFPYGYSDIREGIAAYYQSIKQEPASFLDMLDFVRRYDNNEKNPSMTDVLALVDPNFETRNVR